MNIRLGYVALPITLNITSSSTVTYSYYKKLSASGRISKPWKVVNVASKNTYFEDIYFKFLNMRDFINKRIEKINSENTSGVIMSMMTGERYSVPKDISENYNTFLIILHFNYVKRKSIIRCRVFEKEK